MGRSTDLDGLREVLERLARVLTREECWSDYEKKLVLWRGSRPRVEGFVRDWPEHSAKMRD